MTRLEMITKCVEDQINRGITKKENKKLQINARMYGKYGVKPMSKAECQRWYDATFNN